VVTGLAVGVEHTVTYRVGERHMVRRLLPEVDEFARKPEVMASGWLVGVCEWPAMAALRAYLTDAECSLGTRIEISHLAPVPAGATLSATARCVGVAGRYSEWSVRAWDDRELVAAGTLGFMVVNLAAFVRGRVAPKLAELREGELASA
jgi:fluoroacetyl-CoA thioesterase